MPFNSLGFVFAFLPLTLLGYYLALRCGLRRWLFIFLILASLAFYGIGSASYVPLLLASVAGNYLTGLWIEQRRRRQQPTGSILALGVLTNVAALGWYKYAYFVVDNVNALADSDFTLARMALPLGISFYTFQQIAYLVDVSRGDAQSRGAARYAAFVIFFPQLIAGPIMRYKDLAPQIIDRTLGRFWAQNILIGVVIFAIGLFKKTVIAESAGAWATPVFDAVHAGDAITFFDGWRAALTYKIQLYFDFSGYSDMAVGTARMFGIVLSANFHSPLRAFSIIDYWRRWHMTLQQFIVTYMYQPLALPLARISARRGLGRWPNFALTVATPTVIVFLVSGLWHGAAWTFVLWGLMHGIFLAVNEWWRALRRKSRRSNPPGAWDNTLYFALTLSCAVIAATMFRAETPDDAVAIWAAMLRFDQAGAALSILPTSVDQLLTEPFTFVALAATIIFLFPNTQQLMDRYRPVLNWSRWRDVAPAPIRLRWRPVFIWAVWTGIVLFAGLAFITRSQGEFIYFKF